MIRNLHIRNYALIREADLEFQPGFTVVTGETGAGKSILLGALSLLLGQRADMQALLDKNVKCFVEAHFDIRKLGLEDFFEEQGLDYEGETILRREISAQGKSRAFINDTPVSLAQMKNLGAQLLHIHSQHHNLMIGKKDYQTALLDGYAGNKKTLTGYRLAYAAFREAKKTLEDFIQGHDASLDEDYLRFQLQELEAAQLVDGEEESLEQEWQLLSHAGEIMDKLGMALDLLERDQDNVGSRLAQVSQALSRLVAHHPDLSVLADRLQSSLIEIRDIADSLSSLSGKVDMDPERLAEVEQRLDMLRNLQRKHRVTTLAGLQAVEERFRQQLQDISGREEKEQQLRRDMEQQKQEAYALAQKLSQARKKACVALEKDIASLLEKLKMPEARLRVDLQAGDADSLGENGCDAISFLFAANKGGQPVEMARVASGGEMSRLMLALKSILSAREQLPAIIFDEIDTGISGEVADLAGRMMEKMSHSMQVIAVTHLPQIAGRGNCHWEVFKVDAGHTTATRIRTLSGEERVMAIAAMLSGSKTTEAAVENARALLVGS